MEASSTGYETVRLYSHPASTENTSGDSSGRPYESALEPLR